MLLKGMSRSLALGAGLLSYPLALSAQECLGLAPEPNSGGVEVGIGHQGDGYSVGMAAYANIADRIGVLGGASWGAMDDWAQSGSEFRGLVAVPLSSTQICAFGEYERAEEPFRAALGMTWGEVRERWVHFGLAFAGDLGQTLSLRWTWHAAPEVILRRTGVWGRTTYTEPEVYVEEDLREWGGTYLGGRAMISARHSRVQVSWGLQNRPRIWSDLHWFFRLGFPL